MLLILATEVNLMPDWTVTVQLGIFLATVASLTFFIFKPVLKIIEERKRFTNYKQSESQRLDKEFEKLNKFRTSEITKALNIVATENLLTVEKTKKRIEDMIKSAQTEAKKILDKTDVSIGVSEGKVENLINQQATVLADEIVVRITQN